MMMMMMMMIIRKIRITHLCSAASTKYPAALNNLVAKTSQAKNYKIVVKILK